MTVVYAVFHQRAANVFPSKQTKQTRKISFQKRWFKTGMSIAGINP